MLGYEHTRPPTYQGTTVTLDPLRSNKRTPRSRVDRPAGAFAPQTQTAPGSSQPGPLVKHVTAERLAAFSRYIGSPAVPGPPYALAFKRGPRGLPRLAPCPPSVATRQARPPGRPLSRSRARPPQLRADGSRGGAPYGSRPHWWTGCQIERWRNGRRYLGSARGVNRPGFSGGLGA